MIRATRVASDLSRLVNTSSPPPLPLLLPVGEAHLWHDLLDPSEDDDRIAAAKGVVAADEWARYQRFVFPEGRRQFLATRVLIRSVLSRYAAVDPAAWRFTTNAYGRPELAGSGVDPALRFNLSNTEGVVVCVVSAHHDVGVDVETLDRRPMLDVADRYFSRLEVAALRALPAEEQPDRFLEYWTLKESYIKARGMGLAIPLAQFSFDLADPTRIRVMLDPNLGDDHDTWQFERPALSPRHIVAVALKRPVRTHVRLVLKSTDSAMVPSVADASGVLPW